MFFMELKNFFLIICLKVLEVLREAHIQTMVVKSRLMG